jgi:hypothetical protein
LIHIAYTTDLTEPQFELLEQVLPLSRTYKNVISRHLIINSIFLWTENRLEVGAICRRIFQIGSRFIRSFGGGKTMGLGKKRWRTLAGQELQKVKKKEFPSLSIGDSMCAKNTDTANLQTKGCCWYKTTNGIKRHLLVDVLGSTYFVHCMKASISDEDVLVAIIRENKQNFLDLPEAEDRLTILLDNGHHKEHLEAEIKKIAEQLANCIRIEIAEKITPEQRTAAKAENPLKLGFVLIKMCRDCRAHKCVAQPMPSVMEEL